MTKQKTALILGASSDIGLVLARRYLECDYRVIAHYRSPNPRFEALLAEFPSAVPYQIDFENIDQFEHDLEMCGDKFGDVDVLVNLAAHLEPKAFMDANASSILKALTINLLPGVLATRALGPQMAKRGWGRIVHASSIGVKFGGGRDSYLYSLSKHALEFIPRDCRKWSRNGVLTNVVRIGVTDTRIHANVGEKDLAARAAMIPMGRLATPDEMAHTLFWLGSENNTYITGQVIAASGGE